MKRSEIATIVLIAGVSIAIAYVIGNAIFGGVTNRSVTVKTIAPISSNFEDPDPTIFNNDAINPTVQVQINSSSSSSQ